MCDLGHLHHGRALAGHLSAYGEHVRQMRILVEEQIRAEARQPLFGGLHSEMAYRDRLEVMRQRAALEAQMRAIMDGVIWRSRNPVLAAGWDDWSRLVREEGWR